METISIQLDATLAELLRQLSVTQKQRSESEIMSEALAAYAQARFPLPKGIGKYRSGRHDVSEKAREILRDAEKEGLWP